jgi:hypothetical protein
VAAVPKELLDQTFAKVKFSRNEFLPETVSHGAQLFASVFSVRFYCFLQLMYCFL